MKNKKTHSTVSAETAVIFIILLGAILLVDTLFFEIFERQPKEKPHVNGQPAEQSVSRCNGDCGCCKCKDGPQGGTYEESLWEY